MNSLPAPEEQSAFRVLVVDDDEDTCVMTSTLLQWHGYVAQSASTGDEALRKVASFSPDLVLLDISLPDTDGLQIARAIRSTKGIKDPVIAAVSGYADLAHKRRCAAAGFDHYLLKPVEPVALDQLIGLLEHRAVREETFASLQRDRVAICYALASSQLEFGGLLLDSAAAMRDVGAKARCMEKVQKMQARLTDYVAREAAFSAEQSCALQILLTGLQVRLTSMAPDKDEPPPR